jgi:hypothetical protein
MVLIESNNTTVILVPWRLCGQTNNIKVSFLTRLDARSQLQRSHRDFLPCREPSEFGFTPSRKD